MTEALNFIWTFRYLAVWFAILLGAMTLHSQSAEVLRVYWFDAGLNFVHGAWVACAMAYASCVFAAAANAAYVRHAPRYPRWIITIATSVPLVCIVVAGIAALSDWYDIGQVSRSATLGIAACLLILALLLVFIIWAEMGAWARPLSQRLHDSLQSLVAKRALDAATALFLAFFLVAPLLQPSLFVRLANNMGSLPILLISLSTLMYLIHRAMTVGGSTLAARVVLVIVAAIILALFAKAVADRSVFLAVVTAGLLVAVGWEFRRPRPSYEMATFSLLILFAIVLGLGDIASTTRVREVKQRPAELLPVLEKVPVGATDPAKNAFEAWLQTRSDLDDYKDAEGRLSPYPVFIVAAQGGGLYAAYHVAMVLSHMQDWCPRFAQHVFAISGVSGGSLGAAVFANAVEQLVPAQNHLPCDARVKARSFRDYSEGFLKRDFLSPLVFLSVIPNIAQRAISLLPPWLLERLPMDIGAYDRARGLEYGFEIAAADGKRQLGSANFFDRGTLSVWRPEGATPALVFNTTRADTGEPYLIAPFRIDAPKPAIDGLEVGDLDRQTKILAVQNPNIDIRISTAVGLSARFPFVTPPGTVDVTAHRWLEKQKWLRENKFQTVGFVDGGYIEDSGLETAWQLVLEIKKLRDQATGARAIELRIIPVGDIWGLRYSFFRDHQLEASKLRWFPEEYTDRLPQADLQSPPGSELLAPLKALNASRQFRAWHALGTMKANSGVLNHQAGGLTTIAIGHHFGLTAETNPLPLGWHLTPYTFSRIRARERISLPGTQCGVDIRDAEKFKAEMIGLREIGEGVGAIVDKWLYACAALQIRRALSPKPRALTNP